MGTSRNKDEQAVVTARRLVRWVWLLGLVPLVGVLAAGLQTVRAEDWMQRRGGVTIPEGIIHIQSGHDRRGEHVALLGFDRTAYVLALKDGRLASGPVPSPWPRDEDHRVRLAIADATSDDLVDLVMMRYEVDEQMGGEGRSRELPWECAIYRQEHDRFVLDRIEERTPFVGTGDESRTLCAYGQQFRLGAVNQAAGPLTQVLAPDSKRVIELLAGEPYAVRDMDGDGNQDLLTCQETYDGQGPMTTRFRLYLFRDDEVHAVWSAEFEQLDLWRNPRRYTVLADLDGDGLVEILVCEPRRGEVSVFGIDPAKLVG